MKNHRWKDNTCVKCGVKRKKHYSKLLMAITDYPPYDHYLRKMIWIFSFDGRKWKADRPDCKNVSVNSSVMRRSGLDKITLGHIDNPLNLGGFGIMP